MTAAPSPCRLGDLIEDPEVSGALLALGAALVVILDHQDRRTARQVHTSDLARMAYGPARYAHSMLRSTIRDDARRYEPPAHRYGDPCQAPMIRRDGPCGKTDRTDSRRVTDWETGERHLLTACYRHREWQRVQARRNANERPEHIPTPCANAGGKLREHFPELDWAKLWSWATDGRWVEPPEGEPVQVPTLTVLTGEAAGGDGSRALLSVVPLGSAP